MKPTRPNTVLITVLKQRGITQGELARGAKLSSETRLSRIINGIDEPRAEEILKICRFLRKSASDLNFIEKEVTKQGVQGVRARG